jgi:hypothetical protein
MISAGPTRTAFGEVRQADERHAVPHGVAAPAVVVPAGAVPPMATPAGPSSDAAVFLRAIEVLEECGWHKGRVLDGGKGRDGSVCIALAVMRAVDPNAIRVISRYFDAVRAATGAADIVAWQCAPERTYEDVILALKRAAHGEAFALDLEPPLGLGSNTAGGSGSNGTANATVHEGTARRSRSRGAEPSAAAVPQT